MSFHVGQKVVCVLAAKPATMARIPNGVWPVKGSVYVIREIRDDYREDGLLTILLREIDNSHLTGLSFGEWGRAYREPGFHERGFRPVRETSIECFRVHLAPIKQREEA